MSRGLSSAQQTAAAGGHRRCVPLVEALFDSGTLRLALSPISITDQGYLYTATGPLVRVNETHESANSVEGMEFVFSGLPPEIIAIATAEPYRGRVVRLLKAWLNDANETIGTANVMFVGRMHSMQITEKNDMCEVTVKAEHYEAELSRPVPLRLNNADQQRLYPGDLGCEYAEMMVEHQIVFPSREAQRK